MESQSQEQPHRNSCVTCRAKKIKCIPSEIPGTCQKCKRLQQECKIPGVILRPRREKLVNRIVQLERSLNNVTAELAEQRACESSSIPDLSHTQTPATSANNHYQSSSTNLSVSLSLLDHEDVFQKGILTSEYGETLLVEFKNMARYFPYIVLPEGSTISDFRHERPMLLLAILASASWRNRSLQMALEQQYLNELGVRMVVKGEQSLDILQGLLVYLAWCHFHMKSAYRLVAFAVSNVIGLGLDCRPATNRPRILRLNFDFVTRRPDPPLQSGFRGAEARRAYIGCYAVSTSYALCLRKAGALRYSKYLEECALSLASENQVISDMTLIHYVRLIHHAEEVNEIFGYTDSEQALHFTDDRLLFYIKYFDTQLQTLRSNIPLGCSGDFMLNSSHTLIYAYTHEIGLYNLSNTELSPARMTVLHDCLISIQQIMDLIATVPEQMLQNIMGYSWARVYYSINLAMELTLGIVSPSWNIESVRNIIKLETYLDLFYSRLMSLSANIQSTEGKGNWFQILAENLVSMRNKYSNGLRVRGIRIPDRETQVLEGGHGAIAQNPGVDNVPYGYADISSIDFMLNDWTWLSPDPSLFVNQTL